MSNKKGEQYLAMMVCKQAYEDYVADGIRLVSLKEPFRSKNTFRRFNTIFNSKCYNKRVRYWKNKELTSEDYAVLWKDTMEIIGNDYYRYAARYLSTGEFFNSERFLLFSRKMDGDALKKQAERVVEEWVDSDTYKWTLVFTE